MGTTTYGYNVANEITTINGTAPYSFDSNGNMMASGTMTSVYNAENQLSRVLQSSVEKARYEYDWRGLRTKKITLSKIELYYYDGDSLAYITDQNNTSKFYFVRDADGRLLNMIDYTLATPKSYIYMLDAHGNVVSLLDETNTKVLNYEYYAWCQLTNTPETNVITGSGELLRDANPFRYCGYQYDPEMGLYYLKARYYMPGLGRFLTNDPFISRNRYIYATNNPVNLVDASGSIATPVITGLIGLGISVLSTATVQLYATGTIDLGDLLAAGVSGFIQGALMPILGVTYGGAIAAGALGGAVYQGIHNITHGTKIQEDIVRGSSIGALSGSIGGPYTHPPTRISPVSRLIRGQSSPLKGFYKAVLQERAQKAAVINNVGIRNAISAYYGNIVGGIDTNTINIENVSITSRPLKLIKQRYGEY